MARFSIHFRHHDLWLYDDSALGTIERSFTLEDGTTAKGGIGPIRSVMSIDYDVSNELLFGIWSSLKGIVRLLELRFHCSAMPC